MSFSKILYFIVTLFCVNSYLFAISEKEINEKVYALKKLPIEDRIDSLSNFSLRLASINSPRSFQIAHHALKLSKIQKYPLGVGKSLYSIGASFHNGGKTDSALVYYKLAFSTTVGIKNIIWEERISKSIAGIYSTGFQLDSALVYYRRSMANAVDLKDSLEIANLYNSIGVTYWRKGKYTTAIKLYKSGLKIRKQLKKDKLVEQSLNNIGAAYYNLGNDKLALEYYIEATKVREKYTQKSSPILLNNIGLIYLRMNDFQLSERYFTNALRSSKETNHVLGQGYSHLNFGDLYFEMKEFSSALTSYKSALNFYKKLADKNGIVLIHNKLGKVYIEIKDLYRARSNILEAYKISKIHNLSLGKTDALINLSRIQIIKGKNKSAITNLERALKIAETEKLQEKRLEILHLLSEVNANLNNYKLALKLHHLYGNLKDSLYNEQNARILIDAKEKFETDKKDRLNNFLITVNDDQRIELENRKTFLTYILIATIFVSIIAAYFIYNNRQRKKKNAILLKTKTELEEAIIKLNETNLELQHSNSTKDKFFSIIAHDLKNPFGTLLGATNILKLDDGTMDEVDKKELIDIISNDVEKLYALLENLLYWASSQTKKLKAKKSAIQLSLLASEISELLKSNAKSKNICIKIDIPESLFVNFDEFMLSTILRNLLTNAIKFSYHDASISFIGFEANNKIHLKIKDNGIGISEENQAHIFDESSDFKQIGTDKEKGTGLGLILCRDFVKENNAQILLTSKLNEGTTFELVMEKAIL